MSFTTPTSFDPYHDRKVYHMAGKIAVDGSGDVSPLCTDPPRALNLKRELWTLTRSVVTCRRCRKILAQEPGDAEAVSA